MSLTITEASFQRRVIDLAVWCKWLVFHPLPARTARGWATATQGHVGYPDLTLARAGRVLVVELKREGGKPTAGQRAWLLELGGFGRLWTPADWDEIKETLR
jgi:hypothetical protein